MCAAPRTCESVLFVLKEVEKRGPYVLCRNPLRVQSSRKKGNLTDEQATSPSYVWLQVKIILLAVKFIKGAPCNTCAIYILYNFCKYTRNLHMLKFGLDKRYILEVVATGSAK